MKEKQPEKDDTLKDKQALQNKELRGSIPVGPARFLDSTPWVIERLFFWD
jgi:hypothetical protein